MGGAELSALTPGDPQRFLPDDSRRRILQTRIEAHRIAQRAELDGDQARHEYNCEYAIAVLNVCSEEYCKIAPCLQIYQQWMRDEVEGAAHALDLQEVQETELHAKYAYPPPSISPPAVDPLGKLIEAAGARYTAEITDLLERRDAKYREISRLSLAGGCIGRGSKRFEALVLFHKEIVRKRVEIYKAVADEFNAPQMLSPIRLHTLRAAIRAEIRHAYLAVKDMTHQDCHATGGGSLEALRTMDLRSQRIEASIFLIADSLLRVIEANQEAYESLVAARSGSQTPIGEPVAPQTELSVGEHIESLRLEANTTQEKLAELVKITSRQVQRHTAGDAIPQGRQIAEYCRVFSELLKRSIFITTKSAKRREKPCHKSL